MQRRYPAVCELQRTCNCNLVATSIILTDINTAYSRFFHLYALYKSFDGEDGEDDDNW